MGLLVGHQSALILTPTRSVPAAPGLGLPSNKSEHGVEPGFSASASQIQSTSILQSLVSDNATSEHALLPDK
ncbi:hypothetical protein NOF04DRAFT_3729 [Fusarium oxysporum II5]|uniref:Uncharacterized protein n=2 Tax=Fusarium oxysporum species complex TaxID=171631 RepID=X0KVG3_FUSO5|nr:uncharacterized protein FOIG_07672 [Fusarium odoratissimum NRRL 54006]EXM00730.1 hypothetical protein FOIG_07672 [Fusarium odoratissimum NRRL 54006]KAK2127365.1 hypothetical protein NOF04DRAFT_3729 [Fusarium oxysporum II5]TXB99237.1 hypothetical protein FocTR4_00013269 [Fusarium oxysporum f. sp. cubense]